MYTGAKKSGSLTEGIIEFNTNGVDASVKEAFQLGLLRLVLVTVMLEDQIATATGAAATDASQNAVSEWDRVRTSGQFSLTNVR